MDLDEPRRAIRDEAVAVVAAGVVGEPDRVLAPVGPTDGGAPMSRELCHRRLASAPSTVKVGQEHRSPTRRRLHGETGQTLSGSRARRRAPLPTRHGKVWVTARGVRR